MKKITVNLLAKAAELAETHTLKVEIPENTPIKILEAVADQNPLLKNQILREDGTPRSSTKVLINGVPNSDLLKIFPEDADITVAVVMPCDG